MKFLGKLVMLLAVVLVVLVLAHNVVIKAAAEAVVPAVTGMPLSIQKFDLDILNTSVDIEGILLKNPSGFHDTALLNIPKVLVAYERGAILTGKMHFKTLEFDMERFEVVKNEKGELNLDRLKALQGTQKPSAETPKKGPQAPAKPMPIQIDMMRLKIGRVVYADYSGAQPVTKEFKINLDQSFQNITDLNSVMRIIVLKAMMSSGISNLVNFDINGLQSSVTDALSSSAKLAAETAAKSLGALKTAAQDPSQLAGTAKGLTSEVKDAASSLKNKLNPFKKSAS